MWEALLSWVKYVLYAQHYCGPHKIHFPGSWPWAERSQEPQCCTPWALVRGFGTTAVLGKGGREQSPSCQISSCPSTLLLMARGWSCGRYFYCTVGSSTEHYSTIWTNKIISYSELSEWWISELVFISRRLQRQAFCVWELQDCNTFVFWLHILQE